MFKSEERHGNRREGRRKGEKNLSLIFNGQQFSKEIPRFIFVLCCILLCLSPTYCFYLILLVLFFSIFVSWILLMGNRNSGDDGKEEVPQPQPQPQPQQQQQQSKKPDVTEECASQINWLEMLKFGGI